MKPARAALSIHRVNPDQAPCDASPACRTAVHAAVTSMIRLAEVRTIRANDEVQREWRSRFEMSTPRWITLWGAVGLFALLSRLIVGGYVVDDAYITFRYAIHIVDLKEFTYNAGERVLGTSTPLFTLLVALGYAAGVSPEAAALGFAAVADVFTVLLMGLLGSRGRRPDVALVAAALTVISPAYLTYSVSGMETSVYVACILGALVLWDRRCTGWSGVVSGLCLLCRPDGALVAAILGLASCSRGVRETGRFALMVLLIVAPWIVFSLAYFGTPIPQSIIAKAADQSPWATSWLNFGKYFTHGHYLLLTALAIPGVVLEWRSRNPATRAWLIWGAAYALFFLLTNAFTHFPWYFVPLLPLYFLCVARSLCRAVEIAGVSQFGGANRMSAVISATVVAVLTFGAWRLEAHSAFLDSARRGREAVYGTAARELARVNPSCRLAATEIGTVGYFYRGHILDLVGLVSPEVVGVNGLDALEGSDARWLVTYDTHFDRAFVQNPSFTRSFRLVRSEQVAADRRLEVYERRFAVPCDVRNE